MSGDNGSAATDGVMSRTRPARNIQADIAFSVPIIRRLCDVDFGGAFAVKDCELIAVQAIEDNEAVIRRAGQLCRCGRWTLVKTGSRTDGARAEAATVGPETIQHLKDARASCLAVETGRVMLADRSRLLAAADAACIAVVGFSL